MPPRKKTLWSFILWLSVTLTFLGASSPLLAIDAEVSRRTLADLKGVYVIVEELDPNLQKFSRRADLSRAQLQKSVESQLKEAGIAVMSREEWLRTPGRPLLYVNVNLHEFQKYQFAYNVSVELQQITSLEINPAVEALATTWSINMTGVVNPGTANYISENVKSLVGLFAKAYASVHGK
jgi:hypothetical protein